MTRVGFYMQGVLTIALDYDGTYNKDPLLWDKFISAAKLNGHEIFICTMRHPYEELEIDPGLHVEFTCRKNKHDHMKAKGKWVDIWIDDMPHFIHNDAAA